MEQKTVHISVLYHIAGEFSHLIYKKVLKLSNHSSDNSANYNSNNRFILIRSF